MEKACTEVVERVLGSPRKRKKPWISKESWNLVDQREEINKKIHSTRSDRVKRQLRPKCTEKDREVKRSIKVCADKREWVVTIADEAEEAAKSQHIKTLYGLRKMLCNERSNQSTRVLDKNGNLINSKSVVNARWTEHFKEVFDREAPANPITNDQKDDVHDAVEEITVNEP